MMTRHPEIHTLSGIVKFFVFFILGLSTLVPGLNLKRHKDSTFSGYGGSGQNPAIVLVGKHYALIV
jgi:hypothetical protein